MNWTASAPAPPSSSSISSVSSTVDGWPIWASCTNCPRSGSTVWIRPLAPCTGETTRARTRLAVCSRVKPSARIAAIAFKRPRRSAARSRIARASSAARYNRAFSTAAAVRLPSSSAEHNVGRREPALSRTNELHLAEDFHLPAEWNAQSFTGRSTGFIATCGRDHVQRESPVLSFCHGSTHQFAARIGHGDAATLRKGWHDEQREALQRCLVVKRRAEDPTRARETPAQIEQPVARTMRIQRMLAGLLHALH